MSVGTPMFAPAGLPAGWVVLVIVVVSYGSGDPNPLSKPLSKPPSDVASITGS